MNKRVAYFDCARSLCMLFIVAYWHIYGHFKTPMNIPEPWGGSISRGVLAAFFFVSAYFLGKRPTTSLKDAISFYRKRFQRFYPLYFLASTSLLVIHYLWKVDYISSFKQYICSIFGVSCFFAPAPKTIWFIGMLIPLYLFTPLVNAFKRIWQKMLCCAIIFCVMWIMKRCGVSVDSRMALYFPVYSIGLIVGSCKNISDKLQPGVLMGGLFTFCASVIFFKYSNQPMWHYPVMFGFICFVLEFGKLLSKPVLLSRIFSFISYGSMAAYLFHRQFLGIPLVIMGKLPVWFFYLVILPIFLIIAWFIQRFYDRIIGFIVRGRQTVI